MRVEAAAAAAAAVQPAPVGQLQAEAALPRLVQALAPADPAEVADPVEAAAPAEAARDPEVAMASQPVLDTAQLPTLSKLQCAALVIKGHPDQPDQRVHQERMDMMETTERMDPTERTLCSTRLSMLNHALSAQPDLLDHKDKSGQKDHPDQKDPQESHHEMEFPENKACKDNLARLADQDEKAHAVLQVNPDVLSQCQDPKLHLDHPAQQERQDPKGNQVQMDNHSKAHQDCQVTQASQDLRDVLDHLAHLETLVKTGRKAAASTAPSQEHHQAINVEQALFLPLSLILLSLFANISAKVKQKIESSECIGRLPVKAVLFRFSPHIFVAGVLS